jgi:two-component system, OmpR family, phosphate regulon sensor histidine kinase PhoR
MKRLLRWLLPEPVLPPSPPPPAKTEPSPLDIIQGLNEGLLAVDASRRVLLANGALAPLLNRPPQEAVGRPLWEVLRHRDVNELAERALAGGSPETREVSFPLAAENHWRVHARALSAGAVLTFQDLTQTRRLENVRKDFVANVSHELKTPLTSLRAALETLLDGALEDPAHAREFLSTAQEQVERLQRLIEDLLALSRLEKGGETVPASSALQAAVRTVLASLEPIARKAEVSLETSLPAEPLQIPLSQDEAVQVVMNLADNAVKFNRRGGRVTVAARPAGGGVEISVTDDGPGIPPEDQPRVFERFYRVDKSRGGDAGGTGLGLSIVKHIVENRGGAVRLESAPGRTVFTVSFPPA